MVVRDKQAYLTEANRQLTGERFYNKLDFDPTEEFWALITDALEETYKNDEIGVNVHETLSPTTVDGIILSASKYPQRRSAWTPHLVSAIGNPKEKTSEFIDLRSRICPSTCRRFVIIP